MLKSKTKILTGQVYSGIYIVASDGKDAVYIQQTDIPGLVKAIKKIPKLDRHLKKLVRPWKSTTKITIVTKLMVTK